MSHVPRPSRQAVLAALLLGAFAIASAWLQLGRAVQAPYDPASAGGAGLLVLKLWLEELGYRVGTNAGSAFTIPVDTALLFVYPGEERFSDADVDRVLDWVSGGGTLALVGPGPGQTALADRLGLEASDVDGLSNLSLELRRRLWQAQPLVPDGPAAVGRLELGPVLALAADRPIVPVFATDVRQVTLAVMPRGKGWVWLLSPRHDLTNAALKGGTDGLIVPAILRGVPPGGRIVFDAYHRFGPSGPGLGRGEVIQSLGDWFRHSWSGRALGALLALCFVLRLWGGVRLGPPLVTAFEAPRREAAEYATAMADLYRRGRQTRSVALHHKQRLKRALGRPWQVSADLDDGVFIERLRAADSGFTEAEAEALAALLARLGAASEEREVVKHWAWTSRFRDGERFENRRRDVLRPRDQVVVLRDRQRDPGDVGFLKRVRADQLAAHLAGDADDRRRVHHRSGDAGDHVGRARPGRRDGHADPAARARIAIRHVRGALLVADQDVAHRIAEHRVVRRQNAPPDSRTRRSPLHGPVIPRESAHRSKP